MYTSPIETQCVILFLCRSQQIIYRNSNRHAVVMLTSWDACA